MNKLIKLLMPIAWIILLYRCASHIEVYIVLAIISMVEAFFNRDETSTINVSAVVIGILIAISEFEIYSDVAWYIGVGKFVLVILTGTLTLDYVVKSINSLLLRLESINNIWNKSRGNGDKKEIFIIVFMGGLLVFGIFLWALGYPARISPDGYTVLKQVLGIDVWNNRNQYYYSRVTGIFVQCGLDLFGDTTKAVAFWATIQIITISICIAYMACTLFDLGVSKKMVYILIGIYVLMPYTMAYSCTMWTDVTFGYAGMMVCASLLRILVNKDKRWTTSAIFVIAGVFFYQARKNGPIAFVIFAFVVCLAYRNKRVIALILLIFVLCRSLDLYRTNILHLNGNTVYGMSAVPMQQLSRLVCEVDNLTESEQAELKQFIDIEEVKEFYDEGYADPIRHCFKREVFLSNTKGFWKLYIKYGMKYPLVYAHAYIAQTRGYYGGHFDNAYASIGVTKVAQTELGIRDIWGEDSGNLRKLIGKVTSKYLRLFGDISVLQIVISIGSYLWFSLILMENNIKKKSYKALSAYILMIAVGLTILLSTPVFNEHRYVYILFVSMPLYVGSVITGPVKHQQY